MITDLGLKHYVMVTPNYYPNVGGVEKHVRSVHQALIKLGYNGTILVVHAQPNITNSEATWIEPRKIFGVLPWTTTINTQRKLAFELLKQKESIWHFHDFGSFYYYSHLARLMYQGNRSYLTFHGWEGACPPDPKIIKQRHWCAARVKGHMAIGDYITKWYKTKANVVSYGGVDVHTFSKIPNSVFDLAPRIAYIGRLEPDTGIKELVESMEILRNSHGIEVPLEIYGKGQYEEIIRKFAVDRGLEISLYPPQEDLIPILQKCPILFASGYLTILEAFCARRIVIAFYNNDLREDCLRMHPATSALYICGNKSTVVQSIVRALNSPEGAVEKSMTGWKWAQTQSWDNLALDYLRLWGLKGRN